MLLSVRSALSRRSDGSALMPPALSLARCLPLPLCRISRLVTHPEMTAQRGQLDTSRVLPVRSVVRGRLPSRSAGSFRHPLAPPSDPSPAAAVLPAFHSPLQILMQRFEGLLDRILRQGAKAEAANAAQPSSAGGSSGQPSAADGAAAGAGAGRQQAQQQQQRAPWEGRQLMDLTLSARSLAASFWALGNMKYPLSAEQLDKIAGGGGREQALAGAAGQRAELPSMRGRCRLVAAHLPHATNHTPFPSPSSSRPRNRRGDAQVQRDPAAPCVYVPARPQLVRCAPCSQLQGGGGVRSLSTAPCGAVRCGCPMVCVY